MAHFLAFKNSEAEAIAALEPANKTRPGNAVVEVISEPTSLHKEYCDQDAANPLGHRYVSDCAYISNDADVTAVMKDAFTTLPSRKSMTLWFAMNPCSRRKLPDMALSLQSDHYFALYTVWEDPQDDQKCIQWVRDIMKGVERHADGAYLGDSDFSDKAHQVLG